MLKQMNFKRKDAHNHCSKLAHEFLCACAFIGSELKQRLKNVLKLPAHHKKRLCNSKKSSTYESLFHYLMINTYSFIQCSMYVFIQLVYVKTTII